jgi:hypothetical protein
VKPLHVLGEREVTRPIISRIVHDAILPEVIRARAAKEYNYEEQSKALREKTGDVPSSRTKNEHDGDS